MQVKKKRNRRRLLVDLLMHISVVRCDQLERGRCYQSIGAVIGEGCLAEALNLMLKLKSVEILHQPPPYKYSMSDFRLEMCQKKP